MSTDQLANELFERGFHDVPEPYEFRKMPEDVLKFREAESASGSRRQIAFKEEIARRERRTARLWALFLVVLALAGQTLLRHFKL